MMRITLAQHSGFCMGVKNAVLKIIREINSTNDELYMYGPLIHNPQAIELLRNRGLKTLDTLDNVTNKQVAIRTHGVPLEETRLLKQCAKRVINLTCPRVAKVQAIIKKHASKGYYTIIAGDKDHAEVVGLKSYAAAGVTVISDVREAGLLPAANQYVMVSQTTFDRETFNRIFAELRQTHDNITVFDTICDSTKLRQDDVLEGIMGGNDTLVVVGGKNSANTKRLARIGTDNGVTTLHIETEDELNDADFSRSRNVLVTAGTSTPGWIINNVLEKLYTIKFKKKNAFLKSALVVLELIVRTNLLSALAASFITRFALVYAGVESDYSFPIISFLYIFSMYSINNYFEREFLKLSNPYKYSVYSTYGSVLFVASLMSMAASLFLARGYGVATCAVLGISYLMGFFYSTRPVKLIIKKMNIRLLRKLYYSKIVTCIGWIIVTVLLPAVGLNADYALLASLSMWLFAIIFLRTVILDLIAYQGDLITGRETLPLWIGTKNTAILAYCISAVGAMVYGYVTFFMNNPLFLLFSINIIYLVAIMQIVGRLHYIISIKYELLVDINFIILMLIFLII